MCESFWCFLWINKCVRRFSINYEKRKAKLIKAMGEKGGGGLEFMSGFNVVC